MLRTLASGLGLLAFITAIVIGALAATGIISEAARSFQETGSEANVVEETTQAQPTSSHIDRSVRAGSLTWTIHSARRVNELEGYALPPSPLQGNFVLVSFTVKNVSGVPVTLGPQSHVLLDEKGRESQPAASVNTEYVVPRYAILFNERRLLDPGEQKAGKVVYDLEVPFEVGPEADLSGFELRLGDADPRAEQERVVDLGF